MTESAALDALLFLRHRLRRTAAAVTARISTPRGAAPSPCVASLPSPAPIRRGRDGGVACSCPCSVELPGEIA
jgi:hypothetical protein